MRSAHLAGAGVRRSGGGRGGGGGAPTPDSGQEGEVVLMVLQVL